MTSLFKLGVFVGCLGLLLHAQHRVAALCHSVDGALAIEQDAAVCFCERDFFEDDYLVS